ncbi:MAG: hypothetical protein P0119_22255 [Nitrospira sp.]|nr:hypothetical protein [Nitrospira sp.]
MLSERVEAIVTAGPAGLISDTALQQLKGVLAPFPETATGIFGFETRLDASDDKVDCFLRVRPNRGELDALIETLERVVPKNVPKQGLLGFLHVWRTPGSRLERSIRHIWLEFDGFEGAAHPNAPNILFWHSRGQGPDGPVERSASEQAMLLRSVADATGWDLPDATTEIELAKCVATLPLSACVFCVGFVRRKKDAAFVRPCLHGFESGGIDAYIRRVAPPGIQDGLTLLLAQLETLNAEVKVDFDLTSRIERRLHLEVRSKKGTPSDWALLLDTLSSYAMIDPYRAEAFVHWGQRDLQVSGNRIFGPVLSHVKLLLDLAGPAEAKCYYGVWECAQLLEEKQRMCSKAFYKY